MFKLIFVVVSLLLELIFTKECKFVNEIYVRGREVCSDFYSLEDISFYGQPNWNDIKIENKPGSVFLHIGGEITENHLNFIEALDLSQSGKLVVSEKGFQNYEILRRLNLSGVQLEQLKGSWFSTDNRLEELDLSANNITNIKQQDVNHLENLKSLNLAKNRLQNIEVGSFVHLKRLETLNLSWNQLTQTDFGSVENLQILDLSENKISKLPSNAFVRIPSLRKLIISNNLFKRIDDRAFNGLPKLRSLNLWSNEITAINSNSFFGLKQTRLVELNIGYCDTASIDENSFTELPYLQYLDLSEGNLLKIEENTLFGLVSLKWLNLSTNNLFMMQEGSFEHLRSLEVLDLSNNNIVVIPSNIFLTPKQYMKSLILSDNSLVALPTDCGFFENMPNLEFLKISTNEILNLNLSLPLRKLKKFDFSMNSIAFIRPEALDDLLNLNELLMSHNKLTFFPKTRNSLAALKKISIEGNPWQCPCLYELIEYLDARNVFYNKTGHFDGSRPVCVSSATMEKKCIKDYSKTKDSMIIERFGSN